MPAHDRDPIILDPADCRYLWRLHLKLAWRYFSAALIYRLAVLL